MTVAAPDHSIYPRPTLTWQAAEIIAAKIVSGEYKVNDRIDPDKLLAEFGVSRTVFREAIRLLEGKGMVSAKPQIGTRVTFREKWNVTDPDVTRWLTPTNEGAQYQFDAQEFHAFLASRPDLADNVFHKHAKAAVIAIQKENP